MTIKVTMPQLGESVVEGTVGRWHVRVGDRVEKDQAVVEILTDKADSEVPSPVGGVVTAVLVEEGAVVRNRQNRLSASVDLMKSLGGGWAAQAPIR